MNARPLQIAPAVLFWAMLSCMTLAAGAGCAATYAISVTPKPPTGPGVGKIVMATSGSATVTVVPQGSMTITGGSAVFLATGGGVSTSGTASPIPQIRVNCTTTGTPTQCSRTVTVTIQSAGGATGPAATLTSFSVSTVSCSGCTWGSISGTSTVTLPIYATGDFNAAFNLGMTVTFNPASVSGNASVPYTISAQ